MKTVARGALSLPQLSERPGAAGLAEGPARGSTSARSERAPGRGRFSRGVLRRRTEEALRSPPPDYLHYLLRCQAINGKRGRKAKPPVASSCRLSPSRPPHPRSGSRRTTRSEGRVSVAGGRGQPPPPPPAPKRVLSALEITEAIGEPLREGKREPPGQRFPFYRARHLPPGSPGHVSQPFYSALTQKHDLRLCACGGKRNTATPGLKRPRNACPQNH